MPRSAQTPQPRQVSPAPSSQASKVGMQNGSAVRSGQYSTATARKRRSWISEPPMPTEFDRWLSEQFAATGTFTALIVLLHIAEPHVTPVCSSYVNVVGDEIDWHEM